MSAVISDCGLYRYRLEREVQQEGLVFAYFGVNPSTADASIDDPTVRKWRGFTQRNGGRKFIVGNVFAYRATDVNALGAVTPHAAEGPEQWGYLFDIMGDADVLVPCWGGREKLPKNLHPFLLDLSNELAATGKALMCFGTTKSGDPKHPLFLPYETELEPWAPL